MDRSTTSRDAQGVAKHVVFKEKQSRATLFRKQLSRCCTRRVPRLLCQLLKAAVDYYYPSIAPIFPFPLSVVAVSTVRNW
uniref:Uncharacterized protein n=1 Tax=Romanomermis culicivorax TaxID=13658 RepID=A0A915K0F3_ROMCU